MAKNDSISLPHDAAMYIAIKPMNSLITWRLFCHSTQTYRAEKSCITQGPTAQTENAVCNPQLAARTAWSDILSCDKNQLTS